MAIILAILIFALIILVHELGHFSAARLFKMRVYEFNMGMGPVLLRKRGKKTDYNIKAIPFGGSCKLGEDDEADDDPDAFRNKPVWQRMIVILAGAFLNLVLGLIICIIMVSMQNLVGTTTIHSFNTDTETLSNQTLREGDTVVAVNGMTIFTTADVRYQLANSQSKLADDADKAVFEFTVIRNGERIVFENVEFKAQANEQGGRQIENEIIWIGEPKNFFNVIAGGAKEMLSYSRLIVVTLIDIFRGTYGLNDFAGPVGVVDVIGDAASTGFAESFAAGMRMTLFMAALITVNVGIFNLLPIPALDGARFIFFVVEAIRRKPAKAEVEGLIHFIGFAALMLFMLVITFNDIRKIIFGG
jgi:regulator of sigma E protease